MGSSRDWRVQAQLVCAALVQLDVDGNEDYDVVDLVGERIRRKDGMKTPTQRTKHTVPLPSRSQEKSSEPDLTDARPSSSPPPCFDRTPSCLVHFSQVVNGLQYLWIWSLNWIKFQGNLFLRVNWCKILREIELRATFIAVARSNSALGECSAWMSAIPASGWFAAMQRQIHIDDFGTGNLDDVSTSLKVSIRKYLMGQVTFDEARYQVCIFLGSLLPLSNSISGDSYHAPIIQTLPGMRMSYKRNLAANASPMSPNRRLASGAEFPSKRRVSQIKYQECMRTNIMDRVINGGCSQDNRVGVLLVDEPN
ncbi:hypothetical protein B0H11DRAFT_1938756 [Mycena galericulata]|nr:hypothetical protein B0H11DRAFT_1938756 [Mycena galericulata]